MPGGGGRKGGVTWVNFAGSVLLASQSRPYHIIVYFWSILRPIIGTISVSFGQMIFLLSKCIYMTFILDMVFSFNFLMAPLTNKQKWILCKCPCRAANNCRSLDNSRPKFANVGRNHNLGRTFCLANILLQHLTISFTKNIWLSYTLLFRMYLCVYVRLNFPFVRPKWCPSRTYVLSR